jgi:hypothetical protein
MATRAHGRNGRMYVNMLSDGTAAPAMVLKSWSLQAATDNSDVTSQGDTGKVYVGGLPDASGAYDGHLDVDAPQFYAAAVDGVARKFYLYPVATDTTCYWFGTALFDFNTSVPVDGPATITGDWSAASAVALVNS